MTPASKPNLIDLEHKVFDIKDEPFPRGAWWWWFWLFFFNNPKNPEKPRQLMILWSVKNVKELDCNNLVIKADHTRERSNLDGGVAAWYFDGEKMHHNFLLEQCDLHFSNNSLSSDSSIPTSFLIDKNKCTVKIGEDFTFIAEPEGKHPYTTPSYNNHSYFANKGFSIVKTNHLKLSGDVKEKPIYGSAYFQRVFVTAFAVPWYWGIYHFENGSILSYYNPYILGKSLNKDITFFDGETLHKFGNLKMKKIGEEIPKFKVSGENGHKKIDFTISSYSHSSWTFRRKSLGVIPNKLIYNEYPAVVSDFKFEDTKTGEKIVLEDLGKSVGNAEHTTGYLL